MQLEGVMPPGSYSTDTALSIMARYAVQDHTHRRVQEVVQTVTEGLNPADFLSQMVALRNWVLGNLLYVKDPGEAKRLFGGEVAAGHDDLEMIKSPAATLESGRYDCDCGAVLLASMLLALSIPARFVAVSFHPLEVTGPDGYSHVFTQGLCGSGWVTLDPVAYPNEDEMLRNVRQVKIRYLDY